MAAKYIVRHGVLRFVGEYDAPGEAIFARGDRVVLRSDRGHELGEVLCDASPRAVGLLEASTQGQIVRRLSPQDECEVQRLHALEHEELEACCRFVAERSLQMEPVDAEHLLGGERIVFYFLAEKRIDFRDLVKDLARTYKTRIEMRQIGVRDEAKLLADYGDCGRPVCCNTHLTAMPPVSMRMAKLQKSTLDPSKISGRCGRLKCCLRYEMNVYEEFQSELPEIGARILTRKGQGKVLAQEILARKVLAEFEDGRRVIVDANEILSRLG
jgi:cell fate regulator YaaT (PSP1 superfamily)